MRARKQTPTGRLILELRAIALSWRSVAFRKRAAFEADAIPKSKAETLGTRQAGVYGHARAILRGFGATDDLDALQALASEAVDAAKALDTAPGEAWQTTHYRPATHAA